MYIGYDEVLSGYQSGQMVERWLVFSPLNHLSWLIARENFIILSRQESNKSHYIGYTTSDCGMTVNDEGKDVHL
jgi:hypothetical protein